MSDRVMGPSDGMSRNFDSGLRIPLSGLLPSTLRREKAAILVPPAANNSGAGAASFLSCSSLFWLDLIEVEGHILLAMNFDGDLASLCKSRRLQGSRSVESTINTVFLDDLFDTYQYPEATLIKLGTVICESLRERAARAFPDRSFVAELFAASDGDRIGVRLYQDNRQ